MSRKKDATPKSKPQNPKPAKEPKAKAKTPKPEKTAKAEKRTSALDAALQVLAASAEPLTCTDLIAQMREKKLWQSATGATPESTLNAAIHREIKVKGEASRFAKVGRGKFALSATPK